MTEPEQWAVELWNRAADAADGCATQSFGDDAKAAALTIQRAFEDRERGAATIKQNLTVEIAEYSPRGGPTVMIWVNGRRTDLGGYCIEGVPRHVAPVIAQALKETPDAQ